MMQMQVCVWLWCARSFDKGDNKIATSTTFAEKHNTWRIIDMKEHMEACQPFALCLHMQQASARSFGTQVHRHDKALHRVHGKLIDALLQQQSSSAFLQH